MAELFKKLGRGILYVLVLPITLIVLAIYSIFGLFEFIFVGVKALCLFFSGRNIFADLPEDVKAKKILYSSEETTVPVVEIVQPKIEEPYITSPFEQQSQISENPLLSNNDGDISQLETPTLEENKEMETSFSENDSDDIGGEY